MLADEAKLLLARTADADLQAGSGRDFYYEIQQASGGRIRGLIVNRDDEGVTLVDESTRANKHHTVEWDDIEHVSIAGYS